MARDDEYAIFLNGSYGVGKSAVLDAVGDRLAASGRAFSVMDVDWFHRSWPVAEGDTENTVLEARNIAAVWANYRAAGPRQLVLSGVATSSADLDRYAAAVGLPVRSIRWSRARRRSRLDCGTGTTSTVARDGSARPDRDARPGRRGLSARSGLAGSGA